MEKIKLNNQVVLMRKYVKQAKVHVINKLVKQVKLLQNRKGNEAQIQKAKRKAERFLQEIALLKKIKPDDVSKLALSKARDWQDVLQQKNCTLDDRCLAMLANYGAVQKGVEVFHCSNQGLASKISDVIKQWEEKNKYSKSSPNAKRNPEKREKVEKNAQKENIKIDGKLLSEKKNGSNIKTNNQSASEVKKTEECTFINDKCQIKNKNNSKSNDKQHEISIHSSDNTISQKLHVSNSIDNAVEDEESDIDSNSNDDAIEIEESDMELNRNDDDVVDSITKIKGSHTYDHLKNKIIKKESNPVVGLPTEDTMENKASNSDNYLEENTMEVKGLNIQESDHDDSESSENERERKQETKNTKNEIADKKPQQLNIVEFIKKRDNNTNSSEKKLKAITLLNLDELQGLDEIPVNNATETDQSGESEGGSSENEAMDTSQNKRNDPFFLGCGGEDSFNDVKPSNFAKNNDSLPKSKNSFFTNDTGTQREKNTFFERKENNQFQPKRNFQKFPYKSEKDTFQSFKKDNFKTRNYQDKFKPKNRGSIGRDNPKNQRGLKIKSETYSQNSGEKKPWKKSYDLHRSHYGDNSAVKNKGPHKKDNISDKPLHPSWEAKRKQKELKNTSFQGKRMVFD